MCACMCIFSDCSHRYSLPLYLHCLSFPPRTHSFSHSLYVTPICLWTVNGPEIIDNLIYSLASASHSYSHLLCSSLSVLYTQSSLSLCLHTVFSIVFLTSLSQLFIFLQVHVTESK